jgi:hypothetical protein
MSASKRTIPVIVRIILMPSEERASGGKSIRLCELKEFEGQHPSEALGVGREYLLNTLRACKWLAAARALGERQQERTKDAKRDEEEKFVRIRSMAEPRMHVPNFNTGWYDKITARGIGVLCGFPADAKELALMCGLK